MVIKKPQEEGINLLIKFGRLSKSYGVVTGVASNSLKAENKFLSSGTV